MGDLYFATRVPIVGFGPTAMAIAGRETSRRRHPDGIQTAARGSSEVGHLIGRAPMHGGECGSGEVNDLALAERRDARVETGVDRVDEHLGQQALADRSGVTTVGQEEVVELIARVGAVESASVDDDAIA